MNAESVAAQVLQYQQMDSRVASAFHIFSVRHIGEGNPARIPLDINARAATESGLVTSPLASIQNVKEPESLRFHTG